MIFNHKFFQRLERILNPEKGSKTFYRNFWVHWKPNHFFNCAVSGLYYPWLFKSNLLVLDFVLVILKMKTLHHISVGIANCHSLFWPLVGALSWCKEDYVSCLLSNVNEAWRINSPAKLHKRKLVEGSPLATHIHVLLKESSFCFSVYHAGH